MGMECSGYGYGYGYGYGRYGYGYGRVWVWNAAGYGGQHGTAGSKGVVGADRTVFASADHHCLGEEVVGNIDISKSLGEKLDVRA